MYGFVELAEMYRFLINIILALGLMNIAHASEVDIVVNGHSDYVILLNSIATVDELKAAEVLQHYIEKVSDAKLNIVNDDRSVDGRFIKLENHKHQENSGALEQGYIIREENNNIYFTGYGTKGVLYAVYSFIEQVLSCKKLAPNEPAIITKSSRISIEGNYYLEDHADLMYREVYSMAETDQEYLDWHKLHSMDQSWGLWGHSVFKLVPPNLYWEEHPEYYSLYNGKRQVLQLCLTNPDVFDIAASSLQEIISSNPNAQYWSISANDNVAVCECENCSRINKEEESQAGTLIRFVNRLAKKFPDKDLVTLAYLNTSWPPVTTRPEKNVYIMLSSIEVDRSETLRTAVSAQTFRNKLNGWKRVTSNMLVWDYYTQFTNLLAPFPVEHTFAENLRYEKEQGVYGVFAQMNEFTYGDLLELKMYLLAKLMWNKALDKETITNDFLNSYYKSAAPYVKEYLDKRREAIQETGIRLDIYGNPVNNQRDYLSPEWMDSYSTSLDNAERAAGDPVVLERIRRIRLPLEYTYLQQARSYGIALHGIWSETADGKLVVNENIREKLRNFYNQSKAIGIVNITEDGVTLDDYMQEWESVLKTIPPENLAAKADLTLKYHYVKEYGIKGIRTLHDRLSGYKDFSYNWLTFDGIPLDCIIDFGKQQKVNKLTMDFLENERLWFYKPESIQVYVSNDNVNFDLIDNQTISDFNDNNEIRRFSYTYDFKETGNYRYLRVVAKPLSRNPDWTPPTTGRKPMIACDEIWVE